MGEDEIKKFFQTHSRIAFQKGDVIIRTEEEPSGVYYVARGNIRMYSITEDGKELTLNILKPGAYFPAIWAFTDIENDYYFEAINNCEVFKAPKLKLLKFVEENPAVLADISRRLLRGMNSLIIRIQGLLEEDSYTKVKSVLSYLSGRFGKSDSDGKIIIDLPVTHADIANLGFMARETASIELGKMQKQGIIDYKRKVIKIIKSE
jgi:CRP/FNR family transcriptional regulator, cyclic AMP receptor protein